jgi:hypothetical protein
MIANLVKKSVLFFGKNMLFFIGFYSGCAAQVDSFFIHPGCADAEPLNPLKADEFFINESFVVSLIKNKKVSTKIIAELLNLENDTSLCLFSGTPPENVESYSSHIEVYPRTTKRFAAICIINALYFEDVRYLTHRPYLEIRDTQNRLIKRTRDWDKTNDRLVLVTCSCCRTKEIYEDVYMNCFTQPNTMKEIYQFYQAWYNEISKRGFKKFKRKKNHPNIFMPLYYQWGFEK